MNRASRRSPGSQFARVSTGALVALAVVCAAVAPADANSRKRFKSHFVATSRVIPAPPGRCTDEPGHAPVVGLMEAVGAGDADLLGAFVDAQSQCIRADGTFFDGRFTFTNRAGKTVFGRFFGALIPTFNATFPPATPAPAGAWLVEGNVCVEGGSLGRIEDDCAAGRYGPARGMANLKVDGTGDATVFIEQTIGLLGQTN